MKSLKIIAVFFLAATALMSGCASNDTRPVSSDSSASDQAYGVIDSIEVTRTSASGIGGSGIGAGAIIGGVVGGVLGNQVGGGTGKDIATVAGVAGGAVAGHQIEKSTRSNKQQESYHIRVRLDNGGYQTVTQESMNDLRVGDRVRIESNRVSRY